MSITAAVRQAKLKPASAGRYPTLPARMWTSAAWLAELVVADRQGGQQRPGNAEQDRSLPESDFEFRGGSLHWLGASTTHTRIGESVFI